MGHDLQIFWYLLVLLRAYLQLGALLIAVAALVLALAGSLALRRYTRHMEAPPHILAFPTQRSDERQAA